jgi:signal transduction histidine kinase
MSHPPVPARSVSTGSERPDTNIVTLMWQAMRNAATSTWSSSAGAASFTSDEQIAERLPALWDAVWRAAGGAEPGLSAAPPHTRQLLDAVRRSFVELVHSAPDQCLKVREVIRVLDAIERVQAALERDVAHGFRQRLEGPGGLDLVVEVAHDLRSPLTSILFLAETLRGGQSGVLKPVQERQLALIYSAAFELSSLANDLTELARGGEQLLERQPIPFSIANLLHSVRDIVQPIAEEKGLEVRVTQNAIDHRLGHPAALGRVLLNLVTNALKYTDEGFVEAGASDVQPDRTEFTVRDSGPGIPADVAAKLFEPFDLNATPSAAGGAPGFSSSGLGLAICRRLVTAMGGELRVKTAPQRGSCFYFELPLPPTQSAAMAEGAAD